MIHRKKTRSVTPSCLVIFLFVLGIQTFPGTVQSALAGNALDRWVGGSLPLSPGLLSAQPLPHMETPLASADAEAPAAERPSGFRMDSAHKYLGYSTLLLAVGAAVSSSSEDLHKSLGYAAAGMATLTCISGYLEYSDYFNTDDGFSKTNIHIVSGAAATAGFIITAILGADGEGHGGIGGASTVLMAVPIVILKW